jgi:predicted alpha/beta superfamily hydrolase
MQSAASGLKYDIDVVLPPKVEPNAKYPVMFCMDWYILGDYLKSLPRLMNMGSLTEPYIMVGISQGSTDDSWAVMRTRDFTPARPTDEYSKGLMYPKALEQAGGAAKFESFLIDELIPRIESDYPADSSRRCLAGYSLGALVGVHILATQPEAFQYYLLGSSSLWFNEFYLGSDIENVPEARFQNVRRVYLSVGEKESWDMLKGFAMLRYALKKKGLNDSRLEARVIDSTGHVGAMPTALYDGIRFVFGRH